MKKRHIAAAAVTIATALFSYCHADIWTDTVIEDGDDYDYLYVHDSPPAHTLVLMIGGYVYDLFALDACTITIKAGRVSDLYAENESTVNIRGGTISDVMSYDSSTVNITGGKIPNGLQSGGSSRVNVSAGIIGSFVCATHNSVLNISGGRIEDYLLAYDSSEVNIYGTNLEYDPESTVPNPWGPGRWEGGKITGNWANGAAFEIDLVHNLGGTGSNNTFAHVLLHEVPVPPVIYVDAHAQGADDGSSWTNAFTSLQDALAAAADADEIRVARGVYYPDQGAGITSGDRSATFQLKGAVAVRGGYAGYGAPEPYERDINAYETILSGDLGQNDSPDFGNYSENSYHVVTGPTGNTTALLEGVTVTAGNADGRYPKDRGGGIFLGRSNKPVIIACDVRQNRASDSGAGIYMKDSSATLERCTFEGNKVDGYAGGGIFLRDCFSTTLTRCVFTANVAPNGAGAGNSSGDASFHNCLFSGNVADGLDGGRGGGFWHSGSPSSDMSRLINCTFGGNLATGPGPVGEGGGLFVYYGNAEMYNCILWQNRDRGGVDESAQIYIYSGQCASTHCCIQGLQNATNQNISADPLLLDADGPDNIFGTADDDYRLLPGSPCVNAGDNTWAGGPETLDMAGNPRIQDDTVDIGAYEGTTRGMLLDNQYIKVAEGKTASFTVALSSDPKGPLTVSVNHYSGDSDITIKSGQTLAFDSANFDQPQEVTVAAAEDDDFLHGRALLYVTAPGLPTAGVTIEELDNERSTIVHVDRNAEGANDGATWDDAFTSLQDALRFVRMYAQFDRIHVAQGTYRPDVGIDIAPGDQTASFQLINDITIKGGYAGAAGPDPNVRDVEAYPTVLSGDLMDNDMAVGEPRDMVGAPSRSDNSYHVVTADGCGRTAVLDGFTITAGNAAGGADTQKQGGGIYGHRPTIQNCRITGNCASYNGGGAAFLGTPHGEGGIIDNSTITDNAATGGGGIYGCVELVNSTISHNAAIQYGGGGIYFGYSCETTVTDCTISHNTAEKYAGAAALGASDSKVIFTRCTIMGNSAKENGGAVSIDGCTCGSYPEFHNCTIIGNQAGADGGAIFGHGYALTTLNSCVLIGNNAGGDGGALCDAYSAGGMTVNCTFTANTAAGKGGAIAYKDSYTAEGHQLYNSILWANSAQAGHPQIYFVEITTPPWSGAPAMAIEYCCIQNLPDDIKGPGNIENDPRFVDVDGPDNLPGNQDDDLHLKADSPCINSGNDYWSPRTPSISTAGPASPKAGSISARTRCAGRANGSSTMSPTRRRTAAPLIPSIPFRKQSMRPPTVTRLSSWTARTPATEIATSTSKRKSPSARKTAPLNA